MRCYTPAAKKWKKVLLYINFKLDIEIVTNTTVCNI